MTTPPPSVFYADNQITLWQGDALETLQQLDAESVDCIVTSPPYYGLRDYGVEGQYGLEETPAAYVETMRAVFAEARRVLARDGTLWLNLGDSYSASRSGPPGHSAVVGATRDGRQAGMGAGVVDGLPAKNLIGIPWRVAFALQDDGWILRNHIVWAKPNHMPDSVQDRFSCSHEAVFLFARSPRYWFDLDAVKVPSSGRAVAGNSRAAVAAYAGNLGALPSGRRYGGNPGSTLGGAVNPTVNPGDVWAVTTAGFPGAHFAVMPPKLARRCITAGCRPGGTVLDPFNGAGTTGLAALQLGRSYVGIDLSAEYLDLALRTRLAQTAIVDDEYPPE